MTCSWVWLGWKIGGIFTEINWKQIPKKQNIQKFEYSGFPGGSVIKNQSANAGDMDSIHDPGRSPGGGNGNSLQYSCLGNPMDKGA